MEAGGLLTLLIFLLGCGLLTMIIIAVVGVIVSERRSRR